MSETHHYDIVVVGAGLIGAACALMLAKNTSRSVALIERSTPVADLSSKNLKVVALGAAAISILEEIEVLPELSLDTCYPYTSMFVWDDNSDGELRIEAADHARESLGMIIDSIECNRLLQESLLSQATIDTFFEFEAEHIEFKQQQTMICSDSKKISAGLVIAADGQHSWVRKRAKIFAPLQSFNQKGIVAKIETSSSHQDTAWQCFFNTGPLAILPLTENQSSIVWSADDDYAAQLMGLSKGDFEQELSQAINHRLGKVTLLSKRLAFPLQSLQAEQYCQSGLALIGDAAHSIHPLAGQGANLGFKDVQSICDVQSGCNDSSFRELDVLAKYQRARQVDSKQTDALMKALHLGFKHNSMAWSSARAFGMNRLSDNALLKEFLVKQATGF